MKLAALLLVLAGTATAWAADSTVTVHLLDHRQKPPGEKKFWIDWSDVWRGIAQSKTITGGDADTLIELFRISLKNEKSRNFCGHDPIYGIEAVGKDGKALTTSVCFKCRTWVKPKLRLEIAGESGPDNKLCVALRKVIELPDDVLKEQSMK